jgi:serine/threonine protein kinase
MTPEKIGRYQVEGEIGRGGMATVYKAYDPRFERNVAIKVLPREFMHDPEFRARFNREAKTIATLEHPAIVPVYDYGEDDGQLYLVMRYMPGGSLADKLENGPLSIEECAEILQRLGSALDRAHSQNIIHRDLKPGNVLFDQYGDAFLADFGIVRVTGSDSNLTASGSLVGTPMYMSPEQVYGDKELDGRSDIYALGVILFQMLTGHLPYEADTPAKLMMKHILDPVPDILSQRPDLPPEAEVVVSKALAKERDDRFETASDFSSALSTITKETPISDDFHKQLATIQADIAPEGVDLSDTPIDQAPADLADDVLEDMGLPTAKGISKTTGESSTGRNIPVWAWILVVILFVSCIGLCAIVAIVASQMEDDGTSVETFFDETPQVIGTPTTAAFPLLDPEEAEAATTEAELIATREQLALEATTEAGTLTIEETSDIEETDSADATRESLVATRNAAAEEEESGGGSDAEATRDALAAERETVVVEFPVPAVFGPVDGELLHEADSTIEMDYTGVNLSNFIARANVLNPYSTNKGSWDFGLVFRQEAVDDELRLVVRSDGLWNLNDRSEDGDNFIQEGTVSEYLDLNEGGSNEITLVAFDDMGLFFLNGRLISELDLSEQDDFGEVALGTGFYTSNKQAGEITGYEDFTVWPFVPEFGPRDGELEHNDDGFIKMRGANADLLNFIAEVEFTNPYGEEVGDWDWGFAFRETEGEYWLIVESKGAWSLIDRRPNDDYYIDEGDVSDILLAGDGETNKVSLIVVNDRGYFFLNDEFVAELDLSDRMEAGEIEVITAFFEGNEVPDYTTGYSEFTVWPLP